MSVSDDLIDSLLRGQYVDQQTGQHVRVPIESISIDPGACDGIAEILAPLRLGGHIAVVSDQNTIDVLGRSVERSLAATGKIDSIVLRHPHATEQAVAQLRELSRHADALVAVGSGTVNDLCKYTTFLDKKPYAVCATAASMNGYTSSTASITINGLKTSQPAHNPKAIVMDLAVIAAAPLRLSRSGLGDSLCRSTAQVDWLLSNRLLDTFYHPGPFELQQDDERALLDGAAGLAAGDETFFRGLCRMLTLCGLGVCITGTSHHGSMAEHMISHYIDMFAGEDHPGTLHGEQVGVASLSMARLQDQMLAKPDAPQLRRVDLTEQAFVSRFGPQVGSQCWQAFAPKHFDQTTVDRLNQRLGDIWPQLRAELRGLLVPYEQLRATAQIAGLAQTGEDLGLSGEFYRTAVQRARETRDRFTILDLAAAAGELERFSDFQR